MISRTRLLYGVVLLTITLIAGYIVLNATSRYGVGLSQDSVVYMAAAQNLATGQGFNGIDGGPITLWPPLYPALMALFMRLFNADVLVVARFINVILTVLVVLLTGLYARQLKIAAIPSLAAAAMVAWAFPLVATRVMAWTEPLFIFLILLALIALNHYVAHQSRNALILFAVVAALSAITRYIGVIMIPIGVIVVLAFSKRNWPARLIEALVLALITSIPLALVLTRNWLVSGSLMGPRHPPTITLAHNLGQTAKVTAGWFLPSSLSDVGFVVLVGVLLIELIGVAIFLELPKRRETQGSVLRLFVPTILFIVGYVTFLLYSTTTTNLNAIDDRYLLPIFIPLMIVVFGSLSVILEILQSKVSAPTLNFAAALLFLLLLAWPLRVTLLSMQTWRDNGEGFTAAVWSRNETLQYLRDNPSVLADRLIYSNYPHAVFAQFRLTSQTIPYHYYVGSTQVLREAHQLKGVWPAGEAVIVWFNWGDWQTFLFRPEELSTISNMSEIAVTGDGSIWQASPLP